MAGRKRKSAECVKLLHNMNDGRTSAVTFVFGFFFRLVNTRRNGVPFEIILFIHHHMERNQWAILEVIR